MKRWHEDRRQTLRQWLKHRRLHIASNKNNQRGAIGTDPYDIVCGCDEQIGRFRKQDAYDCGNTRCCYCHGAKYPQRRLTVQEKKAQLALHEQVQEESDELCDLCYTSNVSVRCTTLCGKTIGIECGCALTYVDGRCNNPTCPACYPQEDDLCGLP